ncbi:Uroporphyrinogen-III synthase [Psidium guajava]|nr:Uroporphyrinogen-III synthase [Psidium guajava]
MEALKATDLYIGLGNVVQMAHLDFESGDNLWMLDRAKQDLFVCQSWDVEPQSSRPCTGRMTTGIRNKRNATPREAKGYSILHYFVNHQDDSDRLSLDNRWAGTASGELEWQNAALSPSALTTKEGKVGSAMQVRPVNK